MTADRLREAARVLRERAEAANNRAQWRALPDVHDGESTIAVGDFSVAQVYTIEDGAYIATVHPGVGKALAVLLDYEAAVCDLPSVVPVSPMLAVADAILGSAT